MEENATTTVKHACGHTPSDNTLATKSKHACRNLQCGLCEYKMPNTLAAIQSRQAKLQPLVGSERQVAWAHDSQDGTPGCNRRKFLSA